MQDTIKNRLDYKPTYWLPKITFLNFLIYENFTIVKSKISFKKRICLPTVQIKIEKGIKNG